jgi:hypothetical protein
VKVVRKDQRVGVILNRDDDNADEEVEQRIALPRLENKSKDFSKVGNGEGKIELTPELLVQKERKVREEKKPERQEECENENKMLDDHNENHLNEL